MTRHPARIKIRLLMTNRTSHRRETETVGAAFDRRLVQAA
jgi:hypothetical protein